ncbi:MAG: hypothetical protein OEX12_13460 [Gammaproteobacteria bacterium]|nr:hypothetical protein [Gammaproteobacteria bacterium]
MSQTSTAIVVLTSEEGKDLIGRAVARLPQVVKAKASGHLVITGGTTCRYVAKDLMGEDPGRDSFAVGWISEGELGETPAEGRGPGPIFFDEGDAQRGWPGPILEKFQAGDVYIKGANAIDPAGNTGILMASPVGGTIGAALSIVYARGAELIIPISLQKLIPSIAAIGGKLGHGKVDRVMGTKVGYMPILAEYSTVITEVEAMQHLYGLKATMVASGGIDDCVGAVSLHVAGELAGIDKLFSDIEAMR